MHIHLNRCIKDTLLILLDALDSASRDHKFSQNEFRWRRMPISIIFAQRDSVQRELELKFVAQQVVNILAIIAPCRV